MDKIINFWFPNDFFQKFWFDKTKDEYIIKNFKKTLENEYNNNLDISKCTNVEILEYIILFDQFSRHIFKNDRSNIIFKICNEKALEYALYFLKNRFYFNIKFNYLCFILMPLRHSNEIHNYNIIKDILEKIKIDNIYFNKFVNDKILFEKFKSVTEINYNKINSCINHL